MAVQECCKLGCGTVFVAAAVGLAAITFIALAVIFAPPFFATALMGGSAIYVAIGCGAGTLISALFAALLLKSDLYRPEQQPLTPAEIRAIESSFQGTKTKNSPNPRDYHKWIEDYE